MSHIEWKEEYSLGIPVIDTQHKQFLELMDQAYEAFYKHQTKEELAVLVYNLRDYTFLHFGTEERYFELFKYEQKLKDEHLERHLQLKGRLTELINDFETKGPKIVPALCDFLEDWLVGHLNIVDKKYVKTFKEHGL